ncbi:MAG: Gp138 family membrane-puncturing spike protein, partial [Halanaerobiales bacterium]
EKMRAEITLLNKKDLEGNLVEIPPVLEVPVGFMKAGRFIIRPPYQKGDVVVVVFSEKAIDKLLISGDPENPKYKRKHSLDDAIIVNSLQLESESDLNSNYTSDLLIENQEADSRIVMKENGDMLIETSGDTDIKTTGNTTIQTDGDTKIDTSGATDIISGSPTTVTAPTITVDGEVHLGGSGGEGLSFGETLKSWLDEHTHPGDSGGTTGPPNSSSPAPSSKVFTY